jgi:hypothetical protein
VSRSVPLLRACHLPATTHYVLPPLAGLQVPTWLGCLCHVLVDAFDRDLTLPPRAHCERQLPSWTPQSQRTQPNL